MGTLKSRQVRSVLAVGDWAAVAVSPRRFKREDGAAPGRDRRDALDRMGYTEDAGPNTPVMR